MGRFYVAEPWHGSGLAGALIDECAAWTSGEGHDALWPCSWEENLRARRFYAKSGFHAVGNHPFVLGGVADNDIVITRPV